MPDATEDAAAAVGLVRAALDADPDGMAYVALCRLFAAVGLEPPPLDSLTDDGDEPSGPHAVLLVAAVGLIAALAELGARLAQGEDLAAIALELAGSEDTAS